MAAAPTREEQETQQQLTTREESINHPKGGERGRKHFSFFEGEEAVGGWARALGRNRSVLPPGDVIIRSHLGSSAPAVATGQSTEQEVGAWDRFLCHLGQNVFCKHVSCLGFVVRCMANGRARESVARKTSCGEHVQGMWT